VPAVRPLVVLPTYNEAATIVGVLEDVRAVLPEASILVVDDGSPDGTADRADGVAARLGSISVLRRPGKAGLGSAYRAGFRWGLERNHDVLVEMDSDRSHDPHDLPRLLAALDGADLAIGSRYVPGGEIPDWPWHRRLISRAGCIYAAAALRLPVRDATAGFRAFSAEMLEAIDMDAIRAEGYGFQVELAYRVNRRGGTIVEIPIAFRDRTEGSSKMSWRIVAEAFLLVTGWAIRDRLPAPLARLLPRAAGTGEVRSG
jgi:dolichol-phosphate mannosyltransferase